MLRPVVIHRTSLWRCGTRSLAPLAAAGTARYARHGAEAAGAARGSDRPAGRGFATAAYTVAAHGGAPEQTLFIVGLNEGKFFGQDGAEEGLKLLERVAEHHQQEYELLFGLNERELAEIEADYKVKTNKLTPSRELESARNCEMIPLVQAGMVDRLPRRALGRSLKTTQGHVAWQLWKHPRETVNLYWAYWRRKQYKDLERRKFWSRTFPICSYFYFEERAEVIAIRATEHLVGLRSRGRGGATVLVVGNELFGLVTERLGLILDEEAPRKLSSPEFLQHLRDRAKELLADVPDLTPVLIFVYLGLPILVVQFAILGLQHYLTKSRTVDKIFEIERRD